MASINVKLKNASGDVLYPKTLWSNIEGKPSFIVGDQFPGTATDTFAKTIAWFVYAPLNKDNSIWGWLPAMVTFFPFVASIVFVMYCNSVDGNTAALRTLSFINGQSGLPAGYKLGRIERATAFPTSGSTPL